MGEIATMPVSITIDHALKKYGDNVVIPDLSLNIKGGEFFTLLGPSGCGKTTLLRMIAGFNSIEGGTFRFNDRIINDLEPAKRNIGMVFQNYAIFPHLSVKQNVAFGLKNRKISKAIIEEKTNKYLELMQISQFQNRMPSQLSGGQQQRVALARALAIEPDVLLMDEPLSNLDAKLRIEMRQAIKDIQQHVGITTVYVTHDQEEAMAVSDRIAVFNAGVIQQIGTPQELYLRPANLFVAAFIGKSNILDGIASHHDGKAIVTFPGGCQVFMENLVDNSDGSVKISVRPEELIISEDPSTCISAIVESISFLGQSTHYFARLSTGEQVDVIQESQEHTTIRRGETIYLKPNSAKINIFNADGSQSLIRGVR